MFCFSALAEGFKVNRFLKLRVKKYWNTKYSSQINKINEISTVRELYGGGPQGSGLGIWSYLSQTNNNHQGVADENVFKFVDDKTCLEIINLLSVGIKS